jgi:hypothetical protein
VLQGETTEYVDSEGAAAIGDGVGRCMQACINVMRAGGWDLGNVKSTHADGGPEGIWTELDGGGFAAVCTYISMTGSLAAV